MALGRITAIGWRAAEVLANRPDVRVLAPMRASIYMDVGGQILWLGGPGDLMHPRAVLLSEPPDAQTYLAGDLLSLPRWLVRPWRPDGPYLDAGTIATLRRNARRMRELIASGDEPQGFGPWLTGKPLAFPLRRATEGADALAAACAWDDAPAAAEAARSLLGLGGGLTPSGDDFVGGAFFARALAGRQGGADVAAWAKAATTIRVAAMTATTPISAALLGDLLDGHGWSALHDLAAALASDDDARAVGAARRLTRLGHSSGWDMLAGFVAGAG